MAVVANALAFDRRIDDGKLLQRDDDRASEKRHESQARAVAFLEGNFFLLRSCAIRVRST